jgi:hypothetical protein
MTAPFTPPPTQAEIDAADTRVKNATAAMRAALDVHLAATEAYLAAEGEWLRLVALAVPLRDWLCEFFNRPGVQFTRPVTLTSLAKRSHRPKAELVPVLAQLVAEGLVRQVGNGYLPPEAKT